MKLRPEGAETDTVFAISNVQALQDNICSSIILYIINCYYYTTVLYFILIDIIQIIIINKRSRTKNQCYALRPCLYGPYLPEMFQLYPGRRFHPLGDREVSGYFIQGIVEKLRIISQ